ncbi:MAG: AgmX/PglI C-terminal domain-containing protein [Sandaracinus sp.]
MAHAKTTLTFHIHHGDAPVRTEVLTQDIVKIGKLASSHLRIDDENVSRMHAVIEVTGDGVHVIDLGSATGTIVNGRKVNKTKLESGDTLELGGARVTIDIGVPAEARVAPLAAAAPEVARPASFATVSPAPVLPNPFAAPVAPIAAAPAASTEPASPDEVEYGIAATGPAINPADVETMAIAAEVVILWGDRSVLHVAHLSPPRAFTIGEPGQRETPDFVAPGLLSGGERMPLTVEVGGNVGVVIPPGATGDVRVGEVVQSIEALRAAGKLAPCALLAGAEQYVMPAGAVATVRLQGFTFVTRATTAGKRVGAETETSFRAQLWTGLSLAVHSAFLLMFYFLPPSASALSLDLVRPDDRLVQYLMTPDETVDEPVPDWVEPSASTETEGGTGTAHDGESGSMGDEHAAHTTSRYGIQGPEDNEHPVMARERARDEARQAASAFGTLLTQAGAFSSPTSPYGADQALGADPLSALGALMGDQTGANFGFGGLGPSGTGRGGGGTGLGTIGLGHLGTIGHGAGTGGGDGYGDGVASFHGGPRHVLPHIGTGEAEVRGALSREAIRRTIRRHINEVRFCYEQQLSQRPDLAGRVTVSFIISSTGAVSSSGMQSTTLNNAAVESCIVSSVRRWTFPAPDGGGVVGVNYPFVLDSTGGES